MREVNYPSFIFIDFNAAALTSHRNWTETALQLSENMTFFAICGIQASVIGKEE
jgi:hypothetical protein